MASINLPIWKTAPFIRILSPFVAGIIIQWYGQLVPLLWIIVLIVSCIIYLLFFFLPVRIRYKWSSLTGVTAIFILLALGGLVTWYSDIRNDRLWFGKSYQAGDIMLVKLDEPLIEKPNSYKAFASVEATCRNTPRRVPTKGSIVIYFQKDPTLLHKLTYGSQLLFNNELLPVSNPGNPGSFDYRRYCFFEYAITHQVYLKVTDIVILPQKKTTWFRRFIFSIQDYVLSVIRINIKRQKEVGLAEALLIGYQDDVDRSLMQSYSNTGVVHVIAISGLHLGLIYWLLLLVLKPLDRTRKLRYISAAIIVPCLWLFSILAGAQPSILRSAVMFSFVLISKNVARRISIFNSLAASAFLLLCYNPFWLWDIGFQLSYVALLSIVIFMKPIYNIIYVKNKGLDHLWQLAAISLAAQLLTTPFTVYYFHQFPIYFLITNMVAVPLSSLVLLGEILLCVVYFIPVVATLMGKIVCFFIWMMNSFVEYMESLPFSMWQGLSINVAQVVLLIIVVAGFGYWLIEKQRAGYWIGAIAIILFLLLRSWSFFQAGRQNKLIVYNIPKCQAIDIISGRHCIFIADDKIKEDQTMQSFYLKPSRVMHRISPANALQNLYSGNNLFQFGSKRIAIIDSTVRIDSSKKIPIDLLIITKNPRLYLPTMTKVFDIKQVLLDGAASGWKIKYWKHDCDSLHIPCYITNEEGAFTMNI